MNARIRAGIAAALLLAPSPGFPQQPTQAQANAIKQLCRGDFQTHCAGVPTGGSAALGCLQQNAASLSEPCQQALAAINPNSAPPPGTRGSAPPPPAHRAAGGAPPEQPSRREMALMRRACGPDYRTFCSDIEPGGGRGLACLISHRPQLSSSCRTALSEARQAR